MPIYLAGALLFGLGVPGGLDHWLMYTVSLLLGAMLGIAYRYLYNVLAFWVIEARSLAVLAGTIALFFTGSYIPLPFFPAILPLYCPIGIWFLHPDMLLA